jgi:hypothetical protein
MRRNKPFRSSTAWIVTVVIAPLHWLAFLFCALAAGGGPVAKAIGPVLAFPVFYVAPYPNVAGMVLNSFLWGAGAGVTISWIKSRL